MEWRTRLAGPPAAGGTRPLPRTGDDVRVWFKLREMGKERMAQFEGVIIRVRGAGNAKTFTVRRLTHGVAVERIFPVDAPMIDRIEVLRSGKVHRSRLYFLRRVVKHTRLATVEEPSGPAGAPASPASGGAATKGSASADHAVAAGERTDAPGPHP